MTKVFFYVNLWSCKPDRLSNVSRNRLPPPFTDTFTLYIYIAKEYGGAFQKFYLTLISALQRNSF